MNALQKLRSIVDELRDPKDPMKILDNWGLAGRLGARMPGVDAERLQRVVEAKDITGLDDIVTRLENPEAEPEPEPVSAESFSKDQLSEAMRAFRKRVKLMRLEDESKLRGKRLSSGRASSIDAIMPPGEFPRAIWVALEQEGKLVHTGQGFYMEPGSLERNRPTDVEKL